jgi:hypothetical protein
VPLKHFLPVTSRSLVRNVDGIYRESSLVRAQLARGLPHEVSSPGDSKYFDAFGSGGVSCERVARLLFRDSADDYKPETQYAYRDCFNLHRRHPRDDIDVVLICFSVKAAQVIVSLRSTGFAKSLKQASSDLIYSIGLITRLVRPLVRNIQDRGKDALRCREP